mgnify:CR=1 FL=1
MRIGLVIAMAAGILLGSCKDKKMENPFAPEDDVEEDSLEAFAGDTLHLFEEEEPPAAVDELFDDFLFNFIDDADEREKLPIIGYVSYFKLLNGAESTFYMSMKEMEKHAMRYSQTYRSTNPKVKAASKWTTDFNDMACKTVVKLNLSKNAPLSVEMADAIKADQSIMFKQDEYSYLDNEQQEIDMSAAQAVAEKFNSFDEAQEMTDENK